jgi:hypothetical protein
MAPCAPHRHQLLHRSACLLILVLLQWTTAAAWAQGQAARESAVKAAFLYNFAGFVEWPAGTFQRGDEAVVIGVWGNDAVAADLEQIAPRRTVEGRPVAVRRLRDEDELSGVHVLLLGAAREQRVRELAVAAAGPVLVVTEQDDGLRLGGVLNFVAEDGKVRFAASLPAAQARGLRLSARLLALAQSVEGRPR